MVSMVTILNYINIKQHTRHKKRVRNSETNFTTQLPFNSMMSMSRAELHNLYKTCRSTSTSMTSTESIIIGEVEPNFTDK